MVAALVLGIALGSFVIGNTIMGVPGLQQDPLAGGSYVNQDVEERAAALESQILELEQQIAGLTSSVEALEIQVGRAGSAQPGQAQQTGQGNQTTSATPPENATGTTAVSTEGREMVVNVTNNTGVNVRSGPSTNFNVISNLTNGTRVNVISESSGWSEVELDNYRTGWIRSDLLR